ncbi:MAG: amidohydrolase [Chloroflexota bacterium]
MTQHADIVYQNGAIYTVDANRSWAEAVAVKNGRFLHVGSNQSVQPHIGPNTRLLNLGGKMVLPGIHDMHIHGAEGAINTLYSCQFPLTATIDEIVDAVANFAAQPSNREWIVGQAWSMNLAPHVHKSLIDAVVPNRPVFLWDASHHNAWVNSKALALGNIDANTPNPDGGEIVRDAAGEPTGLLLENAATNLCKIVPDLPILHYQEALRWLAKMLHPYGITSIKEAAVNRRIMEAYKALDDANDLALRVGTHFLWLTPFIYDADDLEQLLADRHQFVGQRVSVDFLKLFLDGVPVTKTAAMLDSYVGDDPAVHDPYGNLLVNPETLKDVLVRFDKEGLIIKMHATGDAALRVALDAIETARQANGDSGLGHEIAHPQAVHPDDLPRFSQLGVVPDLCPILWRMSANHELLKVPVLGRERAESHWPIRDFVELGTKPIAGSDWPAMVPDANPWPGIEAMITRQDPTGQFPGTLGKNQEIDLATALEIYTINGAAALRHANLTGSIEVGKYADMIVLDRNLFAIPPTEIGTTQVELTVLEGEVVFERNA